MGLVSFILKTTEVLIILILAIILIDIIFIKPKKIKGLPVVNGYDFPIIGNLNLIFPQLPDKKLIKFLLFKRGKERNSLYDIDGNKFEYLQTSTCLKFEKLSEKYGPVYQLRFGERNIVIANSYESIIKLWCNNNTRSNNSRPIFYSFHELLSKSKLYTVGTTPFGTKYLNQRRFLVNNLMNNKNLINIVDYETEKLINYLKNQIIYSMIKI
ncbi:binding protein [[Candida] boidinii]|nr:binding protein [[Candida] boidinii]